VPNRTARLEHRVRAQVDRGIEQLLDQRAERIRFGKARNLVPELEVLEDLLDVRREAIQVRLEVRPELLLAGAITQVAEGEPGRVVECLPGSLAQRGVLVGDPCLVERGLHVEHGLLGWLQHGIEPAEHDHRENDVAVFAANVKVPQASSAMPQMKFVIQASWD